PRPRPAAALPVLGPDAQRRQELHGARALAVGGPRRRHLPHRARLPPPRRRAARRARRGGVRVRLSEDTLLLTTRPDILGTFGVATGTHGLATASGMAMLERGGNAFDACAAAAFVLQVVEPHLGGPGGDMPAVFYSAESKKVEVLCAQGTAPQAA